METIDDSVDPREGRRSRILVHTSEVCRKIHSQTREGLNTAAGAQIQTLLRRQWMQCDCMNETQTVRANVPETNHIIVKKGKGS